MNYARTCGNGIRLARRANNLGSPRSIARSAVRQLGNSATRQLGSPAPRTIIVLNLNFNTAVMIGNPSTQHPAPRPQNPSPNSTQVWPFPPRRRHCQVKPKVRSKANKRLDFCPLCVCSQRHGVDLTSGVQASEVDRNGPLGEQNWPE